MDENFDEWLQNQRRERQAEINEISARIANSSSTPERKNLIQNMINRFQQMTSQGSSAFVDESVNGNTNTLQQQSAEHLEPTILDEPTPQINIIDQELGDLIRSQRVSSLLNNAQFRRSVEQRLQNSLMSIRPTTNVTSTRQHPEESPEHGNVQAPDVDITVNVETLMDPNNDPELQALLNYQIVSNMLQSAFRTHLENTLWSRHIRRERHNEATEEYDIGRVPNSVPLSGSQNNLLHSMRNELTEMRSMMRILLQSQIETHRSIRQEVTSVLRSANAESRLSLSNDLSSSCVICLNSAADTVIYRCGHLCLCYACSIQLRVTAAGGTMNCPVCRTHVEDIVRIYGSSHNLTN